MRNQEGSTRQKIITYIRRHQKATALTLSKDLGLSLSAIRQQIALLQEAGHVVYEAHSSGPGRPSHSYVLTDKAEETFERHYDALALEILRAVLRSGGKDALSSVLKERRLCFEKEFVEGLEGIETLEARAKRLAELLKDRGFMPQLEKRGDQLVLCANNCPFLEVAKDYPCLCMEEVKMLKTVLDDRVSMKECRATGGQRCIFHIGPSGD